MYPGRLSYIQNNYAINWPHGYIAILQRVRHSCMLSGHYSVIRVYPLLCLAQFRYYVFDYIFCQGFLICKYTGGVGLRYKINPVIIRQQDGGAAPLFRCAVEDTRSGFYYESGCRS